MTAQNWLWTAAAICSVLAIVLGLFANFYKDKADTESTLKTRVQIAQGTQDTRTDIAKIDKKLDEIHSSLANLPRELAAAKTKQVEAVEVANADALQRDFPFGYGLVRLEDDKRWFFWPRLKPGDGQFDWSKTEIIDVTPTTATIVLPNYLDPDRGIFATSNSVKIRRSVGAEAAVIAIDEMVVIARVLATDENSLTVAVGARPVR